MKIRKQNGLSIVGFLLVLSLVIFFAYIGMRIAPIYLEYWSVVSAMNGVAAERGSAQLPPSEIRLRIINRLYVSYASYDNIQEHHIKVLRRNGVAVRIAYEVRKPLIGNLDVVAMFDRTTRLSN